MATTINTIQSLPGQWQPALPRLRAVVVDDTPEIACAIQLFLEHTGRVENVGMASNGQLAIELVDVLRPDLVVMDVNMPVMNGLLATGEIKRFHPETKVLVVSADSDPELLSSALDCGADDFMPKSNLHMLSYHIARIFPHRFCDN